MDKWDRCLVYISIRITAKSETLISTFLIRSLFNARVFYPTQYILKKTQGDKDLYDAIISDLHHHIIIFDK